MFRYLRLLNAVVLSLMIITFACTMTACEKKGTMEELGEKADAAVEDASDKLEDMTDELKKKAKEAKEKITD